MAPGALPCCSGASPEAADPERLSAAAAAAAAAAAPAPAPAPARGPYTSVSTPPSPRSPTLLTLQEPVTREGPSFRAEGLCASCLAVGKGLGALAVTLLLQPLGVLWLPLPPPPPPSPAASFHKSPGAQPVPAFQAGPAPAAAVPKHKASSPNPHLRRITRRGVESRGEKQGTGSVAATFRQNLSVSRP
nr:putative uncharacterized protein NEXN-AS1 [Macaca fascicularis]